MRMHRKDGAESDGTMKPLTCRNGPCKSVRVHPCPFLAWRIGDTIIVAGEWRYVIMSHGLVYAGGSCGDLT